MFNLKLSAQAKSLVYFCPLYLRNITNHSQIYYDENIDTPMIEVAKIIDYWKKEKDDGTNKSRCAATKSCLNYKQVNFFLVFSKSIFRFQFLKMLKI